MNKTDLRRILKSMRVSVPEGVEKELLDHFGEKPVDDEGHEFQYTEQDIYEQLRKALCTYVQKASNSTVAALR